MTKKIITYSIITTIIGLITIGSTYAFFIATTKSNNLTTSSSKFEVKYTGGTAIEGSIQPVSSKEEGLNTTVYISLAEESVGALADIYINIESISDALATSSLKWEVYKNGTTNLVSSGTFADCLNDSTTKACSSGDTLTIVSDYELSTDTTSFTIYIWLDGSTTGNEVLGASLTAYIGAKTNNIKAILTS